MPKRKNKPLALLTGLGFLALLVVAFFLGRVTGGPKPPVRSPAPLVSRPAAPPFPKPTVPLPGPAISFPPGKGKIAIVLDDWGYTMKQVPALGNLRRPVTLAVLPGLPHSADVARAAQADGHEVILHMPMEALDVKAPREKSFC